MMLPSLSTLTSIISSAEKPSTTVFTLPMPSGVDFAKQDPTYYATSSPYRPTPEKRTYSAMESNNITNGCSSLFTSTFSPLPPISALSQPNSNSLSYLCLATQQGGNDTKEFILGQRSACGKEREIPTSYLPISSPFTSNSSPICPTPMRASPSTSGVAFQPRSSASPQQTSSCTSSCNFNTCNHNVTRNDVRSDYYSSAPSFGVNNLSNDFFPLNGLAETVASVSKKTKVSDSSSSPYANQEFLQVIKPKPKKTTPTRKYRKLPKPPVDLDDFHHKPHRRAYKKKPKMSSEKCCSSCGTNTTPEWRKGPDGPKSLCNACGLQFAKAAKK